MGVPGRGAGCADGLNGIPHEAGAPESYVPQTFWNEERVRLLGALGRRSELFGDLYRRAIDALSEDPPVSHGAFVVAAHCTRDLVNALPDILDDVDALPAKSDTSTPARLLVEEWHLHQDVVGPVDQIIPVPSAEDGEAAPRMTVPVSIVEAARRVAAATHAGTMNAQRRHSALVLGRVEAREDATVKLFRDSLRDIERVRHPGRGREVDVEDLRTRFPRALQVVEGVLQSRLTNFFDTVDDLSDLLDAANEREDGAIEE
jgi:hypothetical protein